MSGASPLYFTAAGLTQLSQYESSGNPSSINPSSTASGLYGFINGTWAQFAPLAGVSLSQYPTAASAPPDIQTQVAAITPASNWILPAGTPGADTRIANAVAANPTLLQSSPTEGTISNIMSGALGGSAGEAGPLVSAGAAPGSDTSTSGAISAGAGAVSSSISGMFSGLESWLAASAGNVMLALIAIVLFTIALWPQVTTVAKMAAE